jgi:adenylate kinase family enzyme
MKKVLVIGSGGAGKSVFARQLGQVLNIDVVHLDALYWHPGWAETPRAEWRKVIEGLVRRDAWIIDGNYSNTLDFRLEACDTVIFLVQLVMIKYPNDHAARAGAAAMTLAADFVDQLKGCAW